MAVFGLRIEAGEDRTGREQGAGKRPANWVQQAAAKEAEAGKHGPPLCPKVKQPKKQ